MSNQSARAVVLERRIKQNKWDASQNEGDIRAEYIAAAEELQEELDQLTNSGVEPGATNEEVTVSPIPLAVITHRDTVTPVQSTSSGVTNLRVDNITSSGATLKFNIDPVVDCTVEIDKGAGFISLSNTGSHAAHIYVIQAQTTLEADTAFTIRVTPIGRDSETVTFATLEQAVVTPPVGGTSLDGLLVTSSFPPQTDKVALPALGQKITLNTGVTIEALPGSTHQYATRAATNLDGTKYVDDAGHVWALPLVAGASRIFAAPVNSERMWSYVDPDVIYGINSGTSTIWHVNTDTGATVDTGIPALTIGRNEGNISGDDKYICVNTSAGDLRVYNLQAPFTQVGNSLPTPPRYDNHKVSLSGLYVFVTTEFDGGEGNAYHTNLTPVGYPPVKGSDGHGVMCVDKLGRDVYVYFARPNMALVLATGETYAILPDKGQFTGTQWHVSYSPATEGYAIISAVNPGGGGWLGLVPLEPGNEEIIVLSDGYMDASNAHDYACQAKISAGLNGHQYVFDSCDADPASVSYLITRP